MSYPIGRSVRCCNMVCPIILILSYESASLILSTFSIGNEFFVLFTIKFIPCVVRRESPGVAVEGYYRCVSYLDFGDYFAADTGGAGLRVLQ